MSDDDHYDRLAEAEHRDWLESERQKEADKRLAEVEAERDNALALLREVRDNPKALGGLGKELAAKVVGLLRDEPVATSFPESWQVKSGPDAISQAKALIRRHEEQVPLQGDQAG